MAFSFLRFLDHIQRRSTVGRTPLDEWWALHRDLYLTTHNTHDKHTCPRRDSNPCSQQASDHWDRRCHRYWAVKFATVHENKCALFKCMGGHQSVSSVAQSNEWRSDWARSVLRGEWSRSSRWIDCKNANLTPAVWGCSVFMMDHTSPECSGIFHHRIPVSVDSEFRWGQLVPPLNTIAFQLIPCLALDCKIVAAAVACYPNYDCYQKVKCVVDIKGNCQ